MEGEMARLVYEFFRPRVSLPVLFAIGVVVQDEDGSVYKAIPDVQLPEDVERAFYRLDDREQFKNEDFLQRVEVLNPENGETVQIPPADKRLLETLQQRGTHHFLYSPIVEIEGPAGEVAAAESERLRDREARREVVMGVSDAATRALLEAYA
jgi:hypothetical protein